MRTTNLELMTPKPPEPEVHSMFKYSLKRERVAGVSEPIAASSPNNVLAFCKAIGLDEEEQEYFLVLLLDINSNIRGYVTVAMGSMDQCSVSIREVFRMAILYGATAIVVVHNHPGGKRSPSSPDIQLTNTLVIAGRILNIQVMDHIIIAGNTYYSFLQENTLIKITIKESIEHILQPKGDLE